MSYYFSPQIKDTEIQMRISQKSCWVIYTTKPRGCIPGLSQRMNQFRSFISQYASNAAERVACHYKERSLTFQIVASRCLCSATTHYTGWSYWADNTCDQLSGSWYVATRSGGILLSPWCCPCCWWWSYWEGQYMCLGTTDC
jgi:hypothetical protein